MNAAVVNQKVSVDLATVIDKVRSYYGDDIAMGIKAGMSVVCSHSLQQREHCLVLIFVGASGKGKSMCVLVFMPTRLETKRFLHRVDSFTPASFVSNAANKKKDQLNAIDLLPKITNKTMLTKELSPLFRGDFKDMQKNFAVLTSVLDGKGYVTQSGSQGERGYSGDYLFNWIGATTPFGDNVYKLMAQLGNRIYFYEIISVDLKEDDLVAFAKQTNGDANLRECQSLMNDFIEGHFQRYPLKTVDPGRIRIPDELIVKIVRYAEFIASGRVEVAAGELDAPRTATAEGPHRIILSLKMFAMGSALADQRTHVIAESELPMIRHIAFSTIPENRRKLLQALLLSGGKLTSSNAATALRISRPTVLDWMKELAATGLVDFKPGDSQNSKPASIELAKKWEWLLEPQPVTIIQTGTDPLK